MKQRSIRLGILLKLILLSSLLLLVPYFTTVKFLTDVAGFSDAGQKKTRFYSPLRR